MVCRPSNIISESLHSVRVRYINLVSDIIGLAMHWLHAMPTNILRFMHSSRSESRSSTNHLRQNSVWHSHDWFALTSIFPLKGVATLSDILHDSGVATGGLQPP